MVQVRRWQNALKGQPMNGRLPRVTADQLLRALMRAGWYIYRQRGSHATLAHPTKRGTVTIARHRGRTVKPKTLAAILVQAGLTVEEFGRLL